VSPEPASDLSHLIQLSVAPVFLLAGIGAFTNVLAVRLGRIFDCSRILETMLKSTDSTQKAEIMAELQALERRSIPACIGIMLDIFAALFVCLLIAIAFTGHWFGFESRSMIGALFIAPMLALIGGLVALLRDVFVAVKSLSSSPPNQQGT